MPSADAPRADFSNHRFVFDDFLRDNLRYGLDPNRPVCDNYVKGTCSLGAACPLKHSVPTNGRQNTVVCKHWLRGLCKKSDACEFLHEYNLRKMPECKFFTQHGWCQNGEECLYVHIDPTQRSGVCEWFRLGYCPLGPDCKKKHIRKSLCKLYMTGFCPYGPECENAHAKFLIPLKGPSSIKTVIQT